MAHKTEIIRGEKYFVARFKDHKVTTQGKTRKEASKNLKEAINLHLESIRS